MAQTTYHGQYPQQYTYNTPTLESYASQYSAQLQQHQYGDYSQTTRPLSPMEEPVDLNSVDATVASQALRRLLASHLRIQGFRNANEDALKRLELEVVAFVTRLYHSANNEADLANRTGAIATDMIKACEQYGLTNADLRRVAIGLPKKRRKNWQAPAKIRPSQLLPSNVPSRSPILLPSDEGSVPPIPATIQSLPGPLPKLPATHTYVKTPIEPPRKSTLPSLEKKLKTAGLVQSSLKSLMLATEDMTGREDGELLGHIVNYEVTSHPRKRWKI